MQKKNITRLPIDFIYFHIPLWEICTILFGSYQYVVYVFSQNLKGILHEWKKVHFIFIYFDIYLRLNVKQTPILFQIRLKLLFESRVILLLTSPFYFIDVLSKHMYISKVILFIFSRRKRNYYSGKLKIQKNKKHWQYERKLPSQLQIFMVNFANSLVVKSILFVISMKTVNTQNDKASGNIFKQRFGTLHMLPYILNIAKLIQIIYVIDFLEWQIGCIAVREQLHVLLKSIFEAAFQKMTTLSHIN